MTTQHVCIADTELRRSCSGDCNGCSFLSEDRRRQSGRAICWNTTERRTVSNILPFSYSVAGGDGTLVAVGSWSSRLPGALLALLITFNLLDVLFTARALSLGVTEANPVMAGLFNISVPFGMFAKFSAVSAGAWLLWRYRHLPVASRGMTLLTACYAAVVIYHATFQLGAL